MRVSPDWAARFAERQAAARWAHERALNAVIEARRRGIKPTPKYAQGPASPSDPRFYTREAWLTYRWRREMGKYDPFVRY
jgi:hypothetical protein